jgi:hypothetical protein
MKYLFGLIMLLSVFSFSASDFDYQAVSDYDRAIDSLLTIQRVLKTGRTKVTDPVLDSTVTLKNITIEIWNMEQRKDKLSNKLNSISTTYEEINKSVKASEIGKIAGFALITLGAYSTIDRIMTHSEMDGFDLPKRFYVGYAVDLSVLISGIVIMSKSSK